MFIFQILQVEDTNFEVEAEIKDWSCKRCTLENPGEMSICQACGGSKLKSLEQPPPLKPKKQSAATGRQVYFNKTEKSFSSIAHCSYFDIYILRKIRLCLVDL